MTRYTVSHWGVYEVSSSGEDEAPRLRPLASDPDPSAIGLHQTAPEVTACRIERPAIREGWLRDGFRSDGTGRGREAFVEVEWDTALDLVAAELERVRRDHGNASIFGGSYGWASAGRFHHAQSQVHRFLNTIGGYVRHTESYSLGAAHVVMPHVVGSMNDLITFHTTWDVLAEHTQLFVAFGGVPVKNAQISPGGAGRHRAREGLERMRERGVRFVNVSPVNDNLDIGADPEWIAIRPNTDTALMLGIAWQLVADGLHDKAFLASHCSGYETFEAYLLGARDGTAKTPEWAEAITGVPAARIVELARLMAHSRTMLNIAWSLQRAHHGEQPFWMLVTLAAMLGQIGTPGGGFGVGYGAINSVGTPFPKLGGPTLSQGRNAVPDYIPVARIADMLLEPGGAFTHNGKTLHYPDIRLVYWAGGNPYHHHQDLSRLERAWARPQTIVVQEQSWTATARRADIVLPATTSLERDDIGYASQEGMIVAMRRASRPFGEARSDYEIFSGLASRMGAGPAFTEDRDERAWLEHLYGQSRGQWARHGLDMPPFETFWEQGLISLEATRRSHVMFAEFRGDPAAHPLPTPSGRIEIFSPTIDSFALADCPGHPVWREPAEWLGGEDARRHPLHLLTDQPRHKLHSQLDASPHSAAAKIDGREPIFLNPADATARGIATGDVVEVFNDRGTCLAAAKVSERIMKGVARMSTGAWYDPDTERGLERHGNPNALTADIPASGLSQGCAAQTCLVDVRSARLPPPAIRAYERPIVRPSPRAASDADRSIPEAASKATSAYLT